MHAHGPLDGIERLSRQSTDAPRVGTVPDMDRESADAWLDAYVEAWRTYEPEQIRALFSDDVAYRYLPYDEPCRRRSVDGRVRGEGTSSRDAPNTYDARYAPIAIDGDVVVARGWSRYRREPGGPADRIYGNCFIMSFDDQGRCRDFTEYYTRGPSSNPD